MFSKPILALDTAAGASTCLLLADGSVHSASMKTPRAHSRELLPMLQNLLNAQGLRWQDIQAFAVGTGPGSFTGLRVACATIAGINASLKKPVVSLSSLAITAKQVGDVSQKFWAIEDARSGLVYAAEFEAGKCVTQPQCLTWQDFQALNPKVYISLSDIPVDLVGVTQLPVTCSRELALAASVLALHGDEQSALWVEPLYLQPSQAEKNLA
ncbi:MAG TPA: tRNA (adenosine(37)-N6)-threonylcarbamoyltransferase complex dimerization subunit type 1 TsaB [Ghiorsea sp.]|nr:tRNA (adenosine(37)-N6)-threonylcarbamoyltransferase complex dimerization subunit type 1 TsaB [Ghiorsea sp.]HIP07563.1 tRNA (adenosine(37)-N6)-threonylcarbamoyltransferase complex dimerization subunit type 1 TsaB [Mariprofundaceae bacterium]